MYIIRMTADMDTPPWYDFVLTYDRIALKLLQDWKHPVSLVIFAKCCFLYRVGCDRNLVMINSFNHWCFVNM